MSENNYDPQEDEGVKKLEKMRAEGATQAELLEAERNLTEQSANGPKSSDPESVIDS